MFCGFFFFGVRGVLFDVKCICVVIVVFGGFGFVGVVWSGCLLEWFEWGVYF